MTQHSSDLSKNRKTAQFLISSQASDNQYHLRKQDKSTRIDVLEKEMKSLIERNNELQQIVKYFQANLSRLSLQIDSDMSIALNNFRGSSYQKVVTQNDYQFLDQSRNFSYNTDNDFLNPHQKKEGRADLMNYLGSIEEEEIQQNRDSVCEPPISENRIPPKQKNNYHEDLMRNLEYQITKVFKLINSKFTANNRLNVSLEERKRDTMGSKGNKFSGARRSQTPHHFERNKLLVLKDSFNNGGGGTGSASGLNQYFVNNHNFAGVRQSNASIKNIQTNFGMSPNSPTMNNLLGNEHQNNQVYYATSDISREENNDNNSQKLHFQNSKKIDQKSKHRIQSTQERNYSSVPRDSRKFHPQNKVANHSQLLSTNYQNELHSFNDISGTVTKQYNSHNRSGGQSYTNLPNLDQTQGSGLPIFDEPMKWMPNEKSSTCQLCQKIFNIFRRKHHCRGCGSLICSKCSPDKDYVAGYKDKKVRICKNCDLTRQRRKTETGKLNVFTSAKTISKKK
ncbi:lateral signaling target protein 2 homolog [Stylonychia lemnae]|uniref:Lateral signaling target protein 2 homolog n=1 Tax=Stylonychia lemnae TaxID=5949 RepID=A0A078A227_STYLE|nr:lateral signaling target protein 2 homolog [Stylonychia lemnae]|eukprot:CDW76286.1 lateral signaling target protein 2 homolog [Stylonychia lemnae]